MSLTCDTANGPSTLTVAYAIGADGAHSSVRHLLGMGFPGHSHEDLFLICDIRATLPFPRERRFFFDPPWNPGRQVLVHPQPDDVWRIDWQVPSGTDVEAERASGALDRRIRAGGRRHDAVRAGLGDRLPLPPAAGPALPRRPRAARRRCGAPDEPVRRARPELGGGRRREPGLEAGAGARRTRAAGPARQLRRRAPRGGRREPGRHRRQHAVHGPARTGCGAAPATPSCAAACASRPCAGSSTPDGCRSRSRTRTPRWWRRRTRMRDCPRTGRWPPMHAARRLAGSGTWRGCAT